MTVEFLQRGQLKSLTQRLERAPMPVHCRIRAQNDIEAMERWLDEYFDKPTTFRTYKKEAERFLVWCSLARKTTLAQLNRDDVEAYIEFIKNPQPKELWCGPRRKKADGTNAWFPFAGPLKESAIKTALASLNSMLSYLVDARYLEANPFSLIRRKNRFKRNLDENAFSVAERILNDDEWHALLVSIEDKDESNHHASFCKHRVRFLVATLFFLSLRLDELARAQWKDFRKINGKWWFFVNGKGDRLGKVPVNSQLLTHVMRFRHAVGLTPLPNPDEQGPLLFSLPTPTKPLTPRQISNLIKDLARNAASRFPETSESHAKLLRFSPHWLRHLSASRQDLAGISFTNIKSNLRHQNEQTTRIYVHAHDDARHREMERLKF